jgi:hypothetical protein
MNVKLRAGLLVAGVLVSGLARAQEADGPSIEHQRVTQAQRGQPLTFTATIHSGHGVFQPLLYFRPAGTESWSKVPLLPSGGAAYAATLPAANVAADFEYYLETYDNDGNGPARAGSPKAPFLVAVADAPSHAHAELGSTAEQPPASRGKTVGGIACFAGGLTGLGVGIYAWAEWNQETNYRNAAIGLQAQNVYQSPIQNFLVLGAVSTGLGAVATGVGIWLLYSGLSSGSGQGSSPSAAAASPSVSIVPVPGGALAGYAGHF